MTFYRSAIVAPLVALMLAVGLVAPRTTMLPRCCLWRQAGCAQLLVARGASLELLDTAGRSPLDQAAAAHATGVVQVLVDASLDLLDGTLQRSHGPDWLRARASAPGF